MISFRLDRLRYAGAYARLSSYALFIITVCFAVSCVTPSAERKKEAESFKRIAAEYMSQDNYTAGLINLLKAEKLNAEDPELHNYLGLTYKAKDRDDLAIVHFKKAVSLQPGYSEAKNNLGTVYLSQRQWDLAIPYFKEAAEDLVYETPHFALSNLGWVYYNKRDYPLAEYYYQKTLDIRPRFVVALRGLALTLMATGRYADAVVYLERAVALAPQIPHFYYDLGEAYSLTGQYRKAERSYDRVLELVPNSPLAAEAKKQKLKIMGRQ
jgi:type IV pilus assembly protein PilF